MAIGIKNKLHQIELAVQLAVQLAWDSFFFFPRTRLRKSGEKDLGFKQKNQPKSSGKQAAKT